MKTNPLDQLKGICEQLLFRVANLHKSFKHFFIETMICYLSISGRINFSQMVRFGQSCESRFRDDVRLRYLYNGPRSKRRGRPKEFDGDVDIKNPREGVFKKTTVNDGGSIVALYFAKVYAVSLKRAVGAVIVVYDDPEKKTQVRKVYFSTDLTLSGEDIYWVYRSRFQIEFLYRDGKQFAGLADCQARNAKSLDFAFNASLSAVNIAKALSIESGLNLSVEDVKLLIHNSVMVQRILSTFGKTPNLDLNQPNIKELLFFGVKTPLNTQKFNELLFYCKLF